MNLNEWSLVCGMVGTALLAITPFRIEWIRYRTNQSGRVDEAKLDNPVILNIVQAANKTTERLIIASWGKSDAFILILGLVLLMLSYALPLFFGPS